MNNIRHLELFYYVARYGGIGRAISGKVDGLEKPKIWWCRFPAIRVWNWARFGVVRCMRPVKRCWASYSNKRGCCSANALR
jgi:hypothetical protein